MGGTVAVIHIDGRLARDAELKYTNGGDPVLHFCLVTDTPTKKGDEWVDEPSFWDVSLWGKAGEKLSPHMTKGRMVSCTGRAKIDRWENNGEKHSKVKVESWNVTLGNSATRPAPREPAQNGSNDAAFDDRITF